MWVCKVWTSRTVWSVPYGGGRGWVMFGEPMEKGMSAAKAAAQGEAKVIHLSPQGAVMDHKKVMALAGESRLVLVCGPFEGVDRRLIPRAGDEGLSIRAYGLPRRQVAAIVPVDAAVRPPPRPAGDGASAP